MHTRPLVQRQQVGTLLMENRCEDGLVPLWYPPLIPPAVMKNNGFVPGGGSCRPMDDCCGSHLGSVHLV